MIYIVYRLKLSPRVESFCFVISTNDLLLLSVSVVLSTAAFADSVSCDKKLYQGHCIIPTCVVNSKSVANKTFYRSKACGL